MIRIKTIFVWILNFHFWDVVIAWISITLKVKFLTSWMNLIFLKVSPGTHFQILSCNCNFTSGEKPRKRSGNLRNTLPLKSNLLPFILQKVFGGLFGFTGTITVYLGEILRSVIKLQCNCKLSNKTKILFIFRIVIVSVQIVLAAFKSLVSIIRILGVCQILLFSSKI